MTHTVFDIIYKKNTKIHTYKDLMFKFTFADIWPICDVTCLVVVSVWLSFIVMLVKQTKEGKRHRIEQHWIIDKKAGAQNYWFARATLYQTRRPSLLVRLVNYWMYMYMYMYVYMRCVSSASPLWLATIHFDIYIYIYI